MDQYTRGFGATIEDCIGGVRTDPLAKQIVQSHETGDVSQLADSLSPYAMGEIDRSKKIIHVSTIRKLEQYNFKVKDIVEEVTQQVPCTTPMEEIDYKFRFVKEWGVYNSVFMNPPFCWSMDKLYDHLERERIRDAAAFKKSGTMVDMYNRVLPPHEISRFLVQWEAVNNLIHAIKREGKFTKEELGLMFPPHSTRSNIEIINWGKVPDNILQTKDIFTSYLEYLLNVFSDYATMEFIRSTVCLVISILVFTSGNKTMSLANIIMICLLNFAKLIMASLGKRIWELVSSLSKFMGFTALLQKAVDMLNWLFPTPPDDITPTPVGGFFRFVKGGITEVAIALSKSAFQAIPMILFNLLLSGGGVTQLFSTIFTNVFQSYFKSLLAPNISFGGIIHALWQNLASETMMNEYMEMMTNIIIDAFGISKTGKNAHKIKLMGKIIISVRNIFDIISDILYALHVLGDYKTHKAKYITQKDLSKMKDNEHHSWIPSAKQSKCAQTVIQVYSFTIPADEQMFFSNTFHNVLDMTSGLVSSSMNYVSPPPPSNSWW